MPNKIVHRTCRTKIAIAVSYFAGKNIIKQTDYKKKKKTNSIFFFVNFNCFLQSTVANGLWKK